MIPFSFDLFESVHLVLGCSEVIGEVKEKVLLAVTSVRLPGNK
jgi:hypothetical protein